MLSFTLNVAILVFSFKYIFWRFGKTGQEHYFQVPPRIISLKSCRPIRELVLTIEGSQDLKECKDEDLDQVQGGSHFALPPDQQTGISHRLRTFARVPQKRLHPRSSKFGGHTAHVEGEACQDRGT